MGQYTHILLAVDFTADSDQIVQRAKALADSFGAKLSLIHVLEPISIAYGGEFPVDLGDLHRELEKQARDQLGALGESLCVAPENRFLEVGITEKEIMRIAKAHEVDLIVLGSHGRRGLALLLGSTANAVLHHSTIDVLAVRVGKKK